MLHHTYLKIRKIIKKILTRNTYRYIFRKALPSLVLFSFSRKTDTRDRECNLDT